MLTNINAQYISIMRDIIVVLSLALAVFAFYKAAVRRDATLIAVGIARLFVAILYLTFIIKGFAIEYERILLKDTAFIIIFMVDLISNIVYFATRKLRADIELQKTRIALAKSEAKSMFILEHSPVAIYQYSIESYKFIYANPAMEELLGYSKQELMHKDIFVVVLPSYKKLIADSIIARVKKVDSITSIDLEVRTKAGKIIGLRCYGKLVFNGEATILGYSVQIAK